MKRTTVMLDEETYEQLKSMAKRKGVSSGTMLREAVATYVATANAGQTAAGPLDALIGMFDLGEDDVAARDEEILKATLGKDLPPRSARDETLARGPGDRREGNR
jgi:predicted transcriptional regulator